MRSFRSGDLGHLDSGDISTVRRLQISRAVVWALHGLSHVLSISMTRYLSIRAGVVSKLSPGSLAVARPCSGKDVIAEGGRRGCEPTFAA